MLRCITTTTSAQTCRPRCLCLKVYFRNDQMLLRSRSSFPGCQMLPLKVHIEDSVSSGLCVIDGSNSETGFLPARHTWMSGQAPAVTSEGNITHLHPPPPSHCPVWTLWEQKPAGETCLLFMFSLRWPNITVFIQTQHMWLFLHACR